ncbi:MAG: glycosyltransferase [Ignavibacteriaceae bacterium]|nr:glycosyltransferase [Ignavibacteriaceae bacterium]
MSNYLILQNYFYSPSYYEGFGLPPLEAMKCGLRSLLRINTSIPEIVGEGGILGNPNDYEFFADSIRSRNGKQKIFFASANEGT